MRVQNHSSFDSSKGVMFGSSLLTASATLAKASVLRKNRVAPVVSKDFSKNCLRENIFPSQIYFKKDLMDVNYLHQLFTATIIISIRASLGKRFTSTTARAGGASLKYSAYI